tara:strand:- start:382 stop:1641 length:1260 start_codon:yes stop_codon:yes gene_type:complete
MLSWPHIVFLSKVSYTTYCFFNAYEKYQAVWQGGSPDRTQLISLAFNLVLFSGLILQFSALSITYASMAVLLLFFLDCYQRFGRIPNLIYVISSSIEQLQLPYISQLFALVSVCFPTAVEYNWKQKGMTRELKMINKITSNFASLVSYFLLGMMAYQIFVFAYMPMIACYQILAVIIFFKLNSAMMFPDDVRVSIGKVMMAVMVVMMLNTALIVWFSVGYLGLLVSLFPTVLMIRFFVPNVFYIGKIATSIIFALVSFLSKNILLMYRPFIVLSLSEVDESKIPVKQNNANIEKSFKQFLYEGLAPLGIPSLLFGRHICDKSQLYLNKNKWLESVAERADSPFMTDYDYKKAHDDIQLALGSDGAALKIKSLVDRSLQSAMLNDKKLNAIDADVLLKHISESLDKFVTELEGKTSRIHN